MNSQAPTPRPSRRPLLALFFLGLPLLGALLAWITVQVLQLPRQRIEALLHPGMSPSEVRERLGEPDIVHHAETAPEEYSLEGWARRERGITSEVWIYVLGEPVCDVWFDEAGLVEETFVGGS